MNDSPSLWAAARSALIAERRYDGRAYDEQSPSTIWHPNGSKVSSFDRQFLNAATAAVLELWRAE